MLNWFEKIISPNNREKGKRGDGNKNSQFAICGVFWSCSWMRLEQKTALFISFILANQNFYGLTGNQIGSYSMARIASGS